MTKQAALTVPEGYPSGPHQGATARARGWVYKRGGGWSPPVNLTLYDIDRIHRAEAKRQRRAVSALG